VDGELGGVKSVGASFAANNIPLQLVTLHAIEFSRIKNV